MLLLLRGGTVGLRPAGRFVPRDTTARRRRLVPIQSQGTLTVPNPAEPQPFQRSPTRRRPLILLHLFFMGYNPNCFDQNCKWNCCNAVGTCPADYQQQYYNATYSICTHYYAIDAATIIGLGLGAALWIFIVVAIVCCFVKLYPRDPPGQQTAAQLKDPTNDGSITRDEEKLFILAHGKTTKYEQIYLQQGLTQTDQIPHLPRE